VIEALSTIAAQLISVETYVTPMIVAFELRERAAANSGKASGV
jgi:hypothetical protein